MELTGEQKAIIAAAGNIKINAVAGSGKTTTVIEYARTRPAGSKILYLVFNKSVKLEAKLKFEQKGLYNVQVETAHSLAYKHIVARSNYVVKKQAYKTHELAALLGIKGNDEKHTEYVIATHIHKMLAYYCNSSCTRVQDLDYTQTLSDEKAKAFVRSFYAYIQKQCQLLLDKMDRGDIEITHDLYLKKFQLQKPVLHYDYILFDEGQDASAAMLDIFVSQPGVKVIVGDTHQQIYGWRHAVNALEKIDFKNYYLSTSFRFRQDIADLANAVLDWKTVLGDHAPVPINGHGGVQGYKTKAIIARSNLGLLLKAIEYVTENKKMQRFYFEGNISSYTYADEGTSLYDVLSLYTGQRSYIKDALISAMKDMDELEDYIEKTDDVQLGMMVEIVEKYGKEIPGIIAAIKQRHVENKASADVVFSTVHRCKGMEYDAIQLVNDFITKERLEKIKADSKDNPLVLAKLNEEVNLLYVAITRTKNSIHLPEALLPVGFTVSPNIHLVKAPSPEKEKSTTKYSSKKTGGNKTYAVESGRQSYKDAYRPWQKESDEELTELYMQGTSVKELAEHFDRTRGAIHSRLRKLQLED